jgi:hypothetical protein
MARGWESKSVEAQQADHADRRAANDAAPAVDPARLARRQTLELARARALSDLQRACVAAHRAMLEAALEAIDAQLAALR